MCCNAAGHTRAQLPLHWNKLSRPTHASSITYTHTHTCTNAPSLTNTQQHNTAIHQSGENDSECVKLERDGGISQRNVTCGGWTAAPGSSPTLWILVIFGRGKCTEMELKDKAYTERIGQRGRECGGEVRERGKERM